MRPLDLQPIGNDLAIKWEDGTESYIPLEKLRRHCPCAGCQGEKDIMGNLHKGLTLPLGPSAFMLKSLSKIGTYAVQPRWADGHATGIYSYEYLERLSKEAK